MKGIEEKGVWGGGVVGGTYAFCVRSNVSSFVMLCDFENTFRRENVSSFSS